MTFLHASGQAQRQENGQEDQKDGDVPVATTELRRKNQALFADQLEGHMHHQLAVVLGEAAEKFAEAQEEFRGFAGAAPLVTLIGDAFGEGGNLGRRFPAVKQLLHGNFESPGHFLQSVSMLGTVWPFSTCGT